MSGRQVIGVIGGCGGVGASRFAAVLAAVAAADLSGATGGPSVLIDLVPESGGIDALVGAESMTGPRWSDLRLAGGWLDPMALADALPRWSGVSVLACDGPLPPPETVLQVVAAATGVGSVVLDLPRHFSAAREAALSRCTLVVLIAAGDISGVTAARCVRAVLGERPVVIVVRAGRSQAARAARLIGAPLAGRLGPLRDRSDGSGSRSMPRPLVRVARGLLAGLESRSAAALR